MAKILIADDRQLMRSALKAAFVMRPKWEVCGEATDGREAVTKVSELQPDLIIMDFKMPRADGIEAAREIFATAPSIPIVMYTLYRNDELDAAAKQVGVRVCCLQTRRPPPFCWKPLMLSYRTPSNRSRRLI